MSDFSCSCGCRWSCAAVAVVISVILGVIAAFLQFAGVIAVAATLLGVVFAVAVGYLAVLLVAVALLRRRETERCLCGSVRTVLTGILGTVLFSAILLVVDRHCLPGPVHHRLRTIKKNCGTRMGAAKIFICRGRRCRNRRR